MKAKLNLILSTISLAVTSVILVVVLFSWYVTNTTANVSGVNGETDTTNDAGYSIEFAIDPMAVHLDFMPGDVLCLPIIISAEQLDNITATYDFKLITKEQDRSLTPEFKEMLFDNDDYYFEDGARFLGSSDEKKEIFDNLEEYDFTDAIYYSFKTTTLANTYFVCIDKDGEVTSTKDSLITVTSIKEDTTYYKADGTALAINDKYDLKYGIFDEEGNLISNFVEINGIEYKFRRMVVDNYADDYSAINDWAPISEFTNFTGRGVAYYCLYIWFNPDSQFEYDGDIDAYEGIYYKGSNPYYTKELYINIGLNV